MRKTSSLFVALAAALVMAVPASAVQFGAPDGNNHPQVGVVTFWDSEGNFLNRRCTGTLISPTRFLTAGHCTAGAAFAMVWFDERVPDAPPMGVPGFAVTKPGFDNFASFPASHDLGMVVLWFPQSGPFADFAPVGYLDTVKKGSHTRFDVVGYGLQDALPPHIVRERARYAGEAIMVNTNSARNAGYNVQLSAAPGTGGAVCHGDSGGPVFLAGTTTIVAVNSLANTHCMGAALSYRTDTADSLAFINGFAP